MTKPAAPPAEAPRKGLVQLLREEQRYQMGAIIALALIPRVAYLVQMRGWPFFYSPVLDSRTQYEWATALVRTFGLGNAAALSKGPLYAYFLALNQVAMGQGPPSIISARLLQLAMGAVTCGFIYLLGRRVFGNAAGLVAGLMAAAYSPMVFEDGELLDTAVATFLATAFLLVALGALDQPTRRRWVGCGLLLGLAGLTRPNLLLLVLWSLVLLAIWDRQQRPLRQRIAWAWPFALAVVLLIVPITIRNYAVTGHLVPIANNGGINFYTGNNPEADGYSPIPAGVVWERAQYQVLDAVPAMFMHGITDMPKAEAYWIREGLAFWREHTGEALALLVKKAYLYWNAYEIPNNVSYQWGRQHASVLRALPVTFAALGPLALLGFAMRAWRGRREWALTAFVALQMLGVIAFFICGRYRMPALPVLFAFSGSAVVDVVAMPRKRAWGGLVAALVGLAVFAVFVNSDWYGVRRTAGANRDWFYAGQSYYGAKQYQQAKDAWQHAIEQHPDDADAYSFLGNAEVQLGDYEAAVKHMRQALEIAPDFSMAAGQMGQLYLQQGWPLEEMARLLERASRAEYLNQHALGVLARIYLRMGRLREAADTLDRAAAAVARGAPVGRAGAVTDVTLAQAIQEAQAAGVPVPGVLLHARQPFGFTTQPAGGGP